MFILSGRLETQVIAELTRLFELQTERDIVLDLKDVGVIDREVMGFFLRCEADGVKLENCPSYIREWMEREKDRGTTSGVLRCLSLSFGGLQRINS